MITRSPLPKRRKGGPRRGRIVDVAMLDWIHTQPCLLALRNPETHRCNGRLTAHHVRQFGSGRDDNRVLPLCQGAHLHAFGLTSIERMGKLKFEKFHGVSIEIEIANYQAMFVSEVGR